MPVSIPRLVAPLAVGLLAAMTAGNSGLCQSASESTSLKTLNDHFPFDVPEDVAAWNERAEALRLRVLVANGLWPLPEKTPLDPVLHGTIRRDGFTVQRVYFQSMPGHFVTGMLFRPSKDNTNGVVDGKRPGVLCPHGHGGRLMRLDDQELAKQIASGSEVHEQSGRYPKLARCAHLARMGCVTFIFDMLGYADSQQLDYQVVHRHAQPRPEESGSDPPCLFSIEADLNLQSVMGWQTWNGIRSLDFLSGLPDVDPNRLGVTGGSGGGTQTIMLAAIDPRVRVAFPNGMVSTSMQGGCYCENCNYLRIDTGNVELAALFAPKPQGMTAADDWTRDMLTDGFPQLQQLYGMLGHPDHVMCGDLLRFPHNYNYVTRAMMYRWMARHLELPEGTDLTERDFRGWTEDELAVWNEDHPAPQERGIDHERNVLRWWKQQNDRKIAQTLPPESASAAADSGSPLADYRRVVGGGWRVIFDASLPDRDDLEIRPVQGGDSLRLDGVYQIRHPGWDLTVEVDSRSPADGDASTVVVEAFDGDQDAANRLRTDAGVSGGRRIRILWDAPGPSQPLVDDDRSFSAFTFAYNRPLIARRCRQLLCVLAAFAPDPARGDLIVLTTGNVAGPSAAAAAVIAGEKVSRLIYDTSGFRFASVDTYSDPSFLPGSVKYLDLPGLLALRAPHPMMLFGETVSSIEPVNRIYTAADAGDAIEMRGDGD